MRAKITKRAVDSVQPGDRDQFLWDTDVTGFGVKVTPAGKRVYMLQTRVCGRLRRLTIGKHGAPWTPDAARAEAVRLLGQVAAGIDPTDAKMALKLDLIVAELCTIYLAEGCATKKALTLAVERGLIERHIKKLICPRRIQLLTRGDVERFLADVATGKSAADERTRPRGRAVVRGGKGTANRTIDLLAAILAFAADRGLRPDNPARGIRKFKLPHRTRFLSASELARLGETLEQAATEGENPQAIAALRLLILTGCRKSEILGLQRDWIRWERSCIELPESKTGAKIVPLGAPALELLRSLPRLQGNDHVLPEAAGKGHLVGLQKIWDRIRTRAQLPDVRLHDLRHSFASVGAAGGDSLFIRQAARTFSGPDNAAVRALGRRSVAGCGRSHLRPHCNGHDATRRWRHRDATDLYSPERRIAG
jgi:integrase